MRLNTYVARELGISGRLAREGIERGGVRVNGKLERFASYKVAPTDKVRIDASCFHKRSKEIAILYEDEELMAINKPVGVVSEPLPGTFLVHRLDKETSGVLLLAKTREMQTAIEGLFYKRSIKKEYIALVEGIVEKDSGKVESYIEKKREGVFGSGSSGKLATTFWECLARSSDTHGKDHPHPSDLAHCQYLADIGSSRCQKPDQTGCGHLFRGYENCGLERRETTSLLKVMPRTGRTHQIRVHLREMGHPVIGDMTYGSIGAPRMMLHAYSLSFTHPTTGVALYIEAPLSF